MRAIQLISETSDLNEVQVNNYKDYYKLLNAELLDVVMVRWKGVNISIYVDEEGMLKSRNLGRDVKGYPNPLFGNMIICSGVDVKGNPFDLPESITIEDVKERISIPLYTIK